MMFRAIAAMFAQVDVRTRRVDNSGSGSTLTKRSSRRMPFASHFGKLWTLRRRHDHGPAALHLKPRMPQGEHHRPYRESETRRRLRGGSVRHHEGTIYVYMAD